MDNGFAFKPYRRTNIIEVRPYIVGEDLAAQGITVNPIDDPETDHGFIGRNPNNHGDMWYIRRGFFAENYEPLKTDA
jgi:hypothetical protein